MLNYEDFHTDRTNSVRGILGKLDLDMTGLPVAAGARLDRLMTSRVWESEKFPMDRAVLMMLHGLTWRFRQDCQRELGIRFSEGQRLLAEA